MGEEERASISWEDIKYLENIYKEMENIPIPDSFDARDLGIITTPKN